MRGLTATVRAQHATPAAVKRSSGSAVRVPTIVSGVWLEGMRGDPFHGGLLKGGGPPAGSPAGAQNERGGQGRRRRGGGPPAGGGNPARPRAPRPATAPA